MLRLAALSAAPLAGALGGGCAGRGAGLFLDDGERAALAHLADLVLPPGGGSPGGAALGVVDYVDRLLSGAGLIFGSGPYSGRTPLPDDRGLPSSMFPPNDFAVAEPLDRVQRAAAHALLFGAPGLVPGDPPTLGLRDRVRAGLAGVTDATALADLPDDFVDLLVELVAEGAWAAPEYGGNAALRGWALIHYEGDAQPFGFSTFDEATGSYRERADAPVSTPNPGDDPAPLDADVRALLKTAVALLGGHEVDG